MSTIGEMPKHISERSNSESFEGSRQDLLMDFSVNMKDIQEPEMTQIFWSEQLKEPLPFTVVGNTPWKISLVGKSYRSSQGLFKMTLSEDIGKWCIWYLYLL